jgi:hypothetical protein
MEAEGVTGMNINAIFDQYDLSGIHAVFCLTGILLCLWCHQLWGRGTLGAENTNTVRRMQRVAFIMMALAMCWSLAYASVMHWQPWPSYVLLLIAVNLYMLSVLLAATTRGKAFG